MNKPALTSDRETIYFVFSLVFSILIYIIAVLSIFGIAIALGILCIMLYINALMIGSIRGNGIRIREQQFPDVYQRVLELSEQMGLKRVPDVFIIQSEGALNAFATRFFGRDMVVIYSEVFELARQNGQRELDFIIAHELAHVRRRHVWKSIILAPSRFVPFLSQAYSRSCEYSCDREAAYYIGDVDASKRALTLLGSGKILYREVNEEAYTEQIHSESNGAIWLSEVLSTHPRLPKRIQAVGQFMGIQKPTTFTPSYKKIVLGASLLFGGIVAAYVAIIIIISIGASIYGENGLLKNVVSSTERKDSYNTSAGYNSSISNSNSYPTQDTPLMTAAYNGNTKEMQNLLSKGAKVDAQNADGATALCFAVYNGRLEAAKLLLDNGANPNANDGFNSVLIDAIYNEDLEMIQLLLEYGADPTIKDPSGKSALSLLNVSTKEEFLKLIY